MTKAKEAKKAKGTGRRDFLKLASLSAPAAVAAASSLGSSKAEAKTVDTDRIQDTAHTRAYYDSARF